MTTFTPTSGAYDHVIVGGGITADKAARAIREISPDATVLMISADTNPPIYRPALSKDLWLKKDATLEGQDLGTADIGVELVLGVVVTDINPDAHTLAAGGRTITYGKLLLATGADARRFSGAPDDPRIIYYRTAGDYRHLRELMGDDATGKKIAIVGGGYIGSELAASLSVAGADVTVYFGGGRLLEHMLPTEIAEHVEQVYKDRGVRLEAGFRLNSLVESEGGVRLVSRDGRTGKADLVVLGLGATPNTSLPESLGLEMDQRGVRVNTHLETSMPDIYAAGDIIAFDDPLLGTRRVEHVDMAEKSGAAAGRNMAGETTGFHYTPFFFSDLFDDGYEAVGELRTDYRTHTVWDDDHRAAVAYYIQNGIVRGVLLWNTWGQLSRAREVMSESTTRTFKDDEFGALITPGG